MSDIACKGLFGDGNGIFLILILFLCFSGSGDSCGGFFGGDNTFIFLLVFLLLFSNPNGQC